MQVWRLASCHAQDCASDVGRLYYDSLSVGDICERLGGAEQSLTSHHLAAMKSKGLLSSSRSGKNIYYSLKMREVIDVIQCLANCTFL
ncbi:MAG: transcriptional regulator [Hymenobacter sp.]|nr:MAG: transcriptional regulator [Hymenobacter sp.]